MKLKVLIIGHDWITTSYHFEDYTNKMWCQKEKIPHLYGISVTHQGIEPGTEVVLEEALGSPVVILNELIKSQLLISSEQKKYEIEYLIIY